MERRKSDYQLESLEQRLLLSASPLHAPGPPGCNARGAGKPCQGSGNIRPTGIRQTPQYNTLNNPAATHFRPFRGQHRGSGHATRKASRGPVLLATPGAPTAGVEETGTLRGRVLSGALGGTRELQRGTQPSPSRSSRPSMHRNLPRRRSRP